MGMHQGRIAEVHLGGQNGPSVLIACPPAAVPGPGEYLLASDPDDYNAALPAPLFLTAASPPGFWAVGLLRTGWEPGTSLSLRGPLGRGFQIHLSARRLALAALGSTYARLMPLVRSALERGAGVTLFGDSPLPALPASVEAYPLESLPEAPAWADYLAFDLPIDSLSYLRQHLGLPSHEHLPCPAEALLTAPMPCGGLGECGACAVTGRRGYRLACKEGPVFDLKDLEW